MKLTARNNRKISSEVSQKNENDGGKSSYDRNYGQGHNDSTEVGQHSINAKRKHSTIGSAYLQRFQIRWRLSTVYFKIGFIIATLWILSVLFLRIWDFSFYRIGEQQRQLPSSSSLPPSTFAVVINTFRRPERLEHTVQHYAKTCGRKYNVGQVFVVWADQETDPPPSGNVLFLDDNNSAPLRGGSTNTTINQVSVEILKKAKDSLNARFEPITQLETTSVFMVDDDIRVDCSSLQMAFRAWQQHPNSMVGFYPRLSSSPRSGFPATDTKQNQFVYHAWPMVYWRQKFNIILTKASFLHSKYLELYTNDVSFPKEIKEHVDMHRNCEDIAMSMLVANYTKYQNSNKNNNNAKMTALPARPFYAEGRVSDVGLFGGISSGTGHFATRSDCLTQLTDILRSKGWGSPLEDEFDLGPSSWVQHSPGFWWQSSPSNIFEWFGLANIIS